MRFASKLGIVMATTLMRFMNAPSLYLKQTDGFILRGHKSQQFIQRETILVYAIVAENTSNVALNDTKMNLITALTAI